MTDEVRTLDELDSLDAAEIVRGYCEGLDGKPFPEAPSKGYIHGWLNSQVDKKRVAASDAQRELVHAYVARGKLG